MGQSLRSKLANNLGTNKDFSEFRQNIHYVVLLGVSIFVFMDMEKRITAYRSQIRNSMSEREFRQNKDYNEMLEQIKDYDGVGVALERLDDTLPTYRYEAGEDD